MLARTDGVFFVRQTIERRILFCVLSASSEIRDERGSRKGFEEFAGG